MLPVGVSLVNLTPHPDSRGVFTELYRESWDVGVAPVQWNVVSSAAGVLRGVHAHWRHTDYLTVVAGRATIGLHDLREDSATAGVGCTVELGAHAPAALVIPTGVAHGFYFREPSVHVYAVSEEFDPADEHGCRYDDPELGIDWQLDEAPLLSSRDRRLGSLSDLRATARAALAQART
jgi:dTDP-4-dehydrorhamnose 3,5-epimerase